jgi:hypothetical protein
MSFEEYLLSKKIEATQFSKQEPQLYAAWKNSFKQVHPNSFTAQKLFQINSIRRKFPKANNTPS